MSSEEYKLLDTISSPRELKKLPPEELSAYCDELRRYIIDECAVNPGHLASSLGAVELAAALHYVFDTPEDRIVWTSAIRPTPTRSSRDAARRLKPNGS